MKIKILVLLFVFPFFLKAQKHNLYLKTDREAYFAGDTVWFKAFLLDKPSSKLANVNAVLYTFLNTSKNPKTSVSRFDRGVLHSQLIIPRVTKPGFYTLKSITKSQNAKDTLMRFNKTIKISALGIPEVKSVFKVLPKIEVFAESGRSLVNFSSRFIVKSTLPPGEWKTAKGSVLNTEGKIITTFYPDYNGLASLSFVPTLYEKYKVVLKSKTQNLEVELPEPASAGYALLLNSTIERGVLSVNILNANNVTETVSVEIWDGDSLKLQREIIVENSLYNLKYPIQNRNSTLPMVAKVKSLGGEVLVERAVLLNTESIFSVEKEIVLSPTNKQTLKLRISDDADQGIPNLPILVSISKNKKAESNYKLKSQLVLDNNLSDFNLQADSIWKLSGTSLAYQLDNMVMSHKLNSKLEANINRPQEYFELKAKVSYENQPYPNQLVRLFIKDKYGLNAYGVPTDADSYLKIDGTWYDSIFVYANTITNEKLDLAFEADDYQLKYIKTPKYTPLNLKVPSPVVLKTDVRRRLYKGLADFTLKPKNLADTTKDWLSLFQKKLPKTKLDSAFKGKVLDHMTNNATLYYVDGFQVGTEALNSFNQKDFAQIDFVYNNLKLKNIGWQDALLVNILTKTKKGINNAISGQKVSAYLAYTPSLNFRNVPRLAGSAAETIGFYPNLVTNKNGEIEIPLSLYNKLINYKIDLLGIDKNGNILEETLLLKNE